VVESGLRSGQEIDPLDAVLLRGDETAVARSTIVGIYVLDEAPSWPRVIDAFERASRSVPRLRQRVVSANVPFSLPYWVVDSDFDLPYHVRRIRLPELGTLRVLLDFAQVHGSVPLDHSRPLWEATIVEGLDAETAGGRAALVLKASHAVADGVAGMAMALTLFDVEPDPELPPMPDPPPAERVAPRDIARQQVQRWPIMLADRGADNLRRSAVAWQNALLRPVAATTTAVDRAGNSVRWTRSLVRTLSPGARPSPVWRERGPRRRYSVLEVPLAELRQAGKAAGGTLNDAYLAAVLGGIGKYHEESGCPIEEIPIAVPMSRRGPEKDAAGNRFAGARFAGPVGEHDPAARIRRIHQLVRARRAEPALDALRTFAPLIARLPSAAFEGLYGLAMSHDLQVSNVPGYPMPVYLAGREVRRIYPFGPVPGVAAMVVLTSHVGVCYIGVNVDVDAVRDPALFDSCLHEGFAEVLRLAHDEADTGAAG
jgi:WS/DGAT/MGAT family acyltransferase